LVTTLKPSYSSVTAITCTLNSLGSGSARQSVAVDNSTNLYDDVLIGGSFQPGTITASASTVISIFVYALTDGTNYSAGCSGTDASYTMPTYVGDLILIAQVPMQASNTIEYILPKSVALAFGGTLPLKWGVVVQNSTGATLNASGNALSYTGVSWTNG
jgi:hypothetical protein